MSSSLLTRRAAALIALALCLALPVSAAAADRGSSPACAKGEIKTAAGCTGFAKAGAMVQKIVNQAVEAHDLKAAIVRVDVGNRKLATASPGESMAGEPATMNMNFRIGSISIPYVVDLLLQLQDRGRLSLNDHLSEWYPHLPHASDITLRMLASATAGYPDWVQGNEAFQKQLIEQPFRQWTTQELLDTAFSQDLICDPGACFHYAHTNFAILGRVIARVTGRPVGKLLQRRVLDPLGLDHTAISGFPAIPEPVLHAYAADRPFGSADPIYEDSTSWSPSYGLPKTMLMTANTADVIRSAKALGTGALISKKASRERFAPITANLPGIPGPQFDEDFYYGLGVLVLNGWAFQNPQINGYVSIQAYLPARKIALSVTSTEGESAVKTTANYSSEIFKAIAAYLTPRHPAEPEA